MHPPHRTVFGASGASPTASSTVNSSPGSWCKVRASGRSPFFIPPHYIDLADPFGVSAAELVKDHNKAVKFSQELQKIGFLRHVCDDHMIDDTNYFFFRFCLDDLNTSKEYDALFNTHEGICTAVDIRCQTLSESRRQAQLAHIQMPPAPLIGGLYTGVIDNTLRLLVPKVRAALRRQSCASRDMHSSYTVMRKMSVSLCSVDLAAVDTLLSPHHWL